MPAYKDEQRGTWYVKFNYEDWTGKKKTKLKRGFKRKKDAMDFEMDFKMKYSGANMGLTMDALFDLYLEDCKSRVKPVTYINRQIIIDKHLRPWFGGMIANEVKPVNVRQWQNHCLTVEYAPGKKHSTNAVSNWHSLLSGCFIYGGTFHGVKDNPARICGSPTKGKQKTSRIKFWTKEQFEEYLDYVPRKEYRFLFITLFYSGMRIGELMALKQDDIDWKASTIRVDETYSEMPGGPVFQSPKTESSNRTIVMPDWYMKDLKEYLEWCYGLSEDDRIFFWAKHASTVHDYFVNRQKDSGLPRITVHDLRHSHASHLIDIGMPILMIAERLGHGDPSMTLKIYSHLYPSKQQELAELLEK